MENGTDGQAVTGRVQCYRMAEAIAESTRTTCSQRGHIDILAAVIALAQRRLPRAAGKVRIPETEQIHRAGPERRIALAIIEIGADSQAVARCVQSH